MNQRDCGPSTSHAQRTRYTEATERDGINKGNSTLIVTAGTETISMNIYPQKIQLHYRTMQYRRT
jgi:hypothetical protein